ncbi:hypothetical protein B0H34DRAFT_520723 [Crassisporium funariophilum]|nr:hypothetical protein B0H34DRAFT_520723 [Crassisporium funariophilum]
MSNKTFFTTLEDIAYSVVEFIPVLGTLYSFTRTQTAHREHDTKRMWTSLANSAQGAVRDVIMIGAVMEPLPVAVIHMAVEGFTDKIADLFTNTSAPPQIRIQAKPDEVKNHHVIVFGESISHSQAVLVKANTNKSLGTLHFHNSIFVGKLNYTPYASNENFFVVFPDGLSDTGRAYVLLTWTKNGSGIEKYRSVSSFHPARQSLGLSLLGDNGFQMKDPEDAWYWYKGVVKGRDSIQIDMYEPSGAKVASIAATRYVHGQ